ncbi:MAG: hypothetical protein ACT4P2_06920 [Pseudomonadota bacterium]
METVETIDAILAARKSVVGVVRWMASRETAVRLKASLEIEGEVRAGLFLTADATGHMRPQQGSLVLVYRNAVIERMSVFPPSAHANPLHKALPRTLRGCILPASAHRYHSWSANRRWPQPPGDNLPVAEPIDEELDSFAAAVQYFCRRANIGGTVPPPPHQPRLPLR